MDTISCIARYPWRTLAALAAVYDVPAHHHRSKESVAQKLADTIHAHLPRTLAALDSEARAALRALTQTEGLAIPRPDFAARFGPLHPYRPWSPKAQPAPWPTPPSPAAVLVHYGLAYPLDLGTRRRPVRAVLLPHDLFPIVAQELEVGDSRLQSSSPQSAICTRHSIDADVFAFLSLLNRREVSVRHGRWLSPRALSALNEHLRPPDDLGAGRSETQAARIPFVHYLAERAGLVGLIGGHLKPTLIAQEWLALPRYKRLETLWNAWCEPSDENRALWRRYRLPALDEDGDPLARFDALRTLLALCQPGPLGAPDNLVNILAERDPEILRPQATYQTWAELDPVAQVDFRRDARSVLIRLLIGPLTWFGLLESQPVNGPAGDSILSLTPVGAALLARDDGERLTDPAPIPLRIVPLLDHTLQEAAIFLEAPAELPLSDRLVIESVVPPDPALPGHYRLTRSRLLHALQRGHTIEGVINFLERVGATPLPAPVVGALYRWAEAFDRVTVRQAVLLQTRDAGLLREISAKRRIRETLGKTLNARTVEVRADRLDALLRRLARQGATPRLDLPRPHPSPLSGKKRGQGEGALIATALRIHAHLADALGLPASHVHTLARHWSEGLSLPLRDAADHTVAETLDALHSAAPLEAEDHLPAPTGPLIETLEAAVREGCIVEIEYYTAGRTHHTTRRVEPLRLEWRGDVVYLIAHCHLRGDSRVFRVDRIERIDRAESRNEHPSTCSIQAIGD